MATVDFSNSGYQLLDSGNQTKTEKFGDKIIIRPSSQAVWKQRDNKIVADAKYIPDRGWIFKDQKFSNWLINLNQVTIELELQSNGQIGLFPEHASYLEQLTSFKSAKTLSLFAYTGLATCFLAKHLGCHVTHVDLSKKALNWANRNIELNKIERSQIRLIEEDALKFMRNEIRRGNKYDLLVIDPPSFSRVSKADSWTIEDKLADICELCFTVLNPDKGALFFTNHSSNNTTEVIRNLAFDYLPKAQVIAEAAQLMLEEVGSGRRLPAGAMVSVVWG